MGKGSMPRRRKDDFDWDNPDSLANLDKEPENMEKTGLSEVGESKGNSKKDKKNKNKKKGDEEEASAPQHERCEGSENVEDKGGKKGKKSTRAASDNIEVTNEVSLPPEQNQSDEESSEEEAPTPAKSKGKVKPGASSFAALAGSGGDDDDDDDESEEEEKKPALAKSKGKAVTPSFAALAQDDDDEQESEEEQKVASKPVPKKTAASFAAIAKDDDDGEEEESSDDEEVEVKKVVRGKGKKGKKGLKDEDEDVKPSTSASSAKPKQKPAAKAQAASFAALMDDAESGVSDEDDDEEVEDKKKSKKEEKKKEKKSKDDKKDDKKKGKTVEPEAPSEIPLPSLSLEDQKVLKKALEKTVFKGVCVGLIKSIAKHPKANDLFVLVVTDGGFTEAQVVTNNTKVAVGMKVAFAPVGSEVVDEELGVGTTKIKAVKLKNVNSAGMLCSGKLLGLNEDAEHVLELPATCPLGIDVGEAYIRLIKPEVLEDARKAAEEARVARTRLTEGGKDKAQKAKRKE